MDATSFLKRHHRRARRLFDAYERVIFRSLRQKLRVFDRIKQELLEHAEVIETLLYSAVRDCPSPEAEELLRKAISQHDQIGRLIGEISLLRPNERQYDGKIRVLREWLDRHVEEEEGKVFCALRRCLSRKELERLGGEMEALQQDRRGVNRGYLGRPRAVG